MNPSSRDSKPSRGCRSRPSRSAVPSRGRPPTRGRACPPRCGSGRRCAVRRAGVAVDGPCGVAAVAGVLLRGLAPRATFRPSLKTSTSASVSVRLARQLDADEAAVRPLRLRAAGGEGFRQAVEQRQDPGIQARAEAGVGDERHRVEQVLERPDRPVRELPGFLGRAVGGDQGDEPQLAGHGQVAPDGQRFQLAAGGGQLGGGTARQEPDEVEDDALVAPAFLGVLVADRVEQDVELALAVAPRQVGERVASGLVADPLAEEKFQVDGAGAGHLEELVGAHCLEEEPAPTSLVNWIGRPSATAFFIGLDARRGDRQVGGLRAQHPPHVPHLGPVQRAERRVAEARVGCVERRHGLTVGAVERPVEAVDQRGVRMRVGHVLAVPLSAGPRAAGTA